MNIEVKNLRGYKEWKIDLKRKWRKVREKSEEHDTMNQNEGILVVQIWGNKEIHFKTPRREGLDFIVQKTHPKFPAKWKRKDSHQSRNPEMSKHRDQEPKILQWEKIGLKVRTKNLRSLAQDLQSGKLAGYEEMPKIGNLSQVWWYSSIVPALWRQKLEDCKFKASLGYLMRLCHKNQPTNQPTNQPVITTRTTKRLGIHALLRH
jgi:hypothetical protein